MCREHCLLFPTIHIWNSAMTVQKTRGLLRLLLGSAGQGLLGGPPGTVFLGWPLAWLMAVGEPLQGATGWDRGWLILLLPLAASGGWGLGFSFKAGRAGVAAGSCFARHAGLHESRH